MNLFYEFEKAMDLEAYIAKLGDQRALHELHYKKALVSKDVKKYNAIKILIITEPWCGDSTAIIPVLQKIFENNKTEIRVALRDENPDLIDLFLTNGNRAIPIVLVLDEDADLIMRYGPRPERVQDIFESYRKEIEEGKIEKKDVTRKIRTFYAKDRGKEIAKTFIDAFNKNLEFFPNRISNIT